MCHIFSPLYFQMCLKFIILGLCCFSNQSICQSYIYICVHWCVVCIYIYILLNNARVRIRNGVNIAIHILTYNLNVDNWINVNDLVVIPVFARRCMYSFVSSRLPMVNVFSEHIFPFFDQRDKGHGVNSILSQFFRSASDEFFVSDWICCRCYQILTLCRAVVVGAELLWSVPSCCNEIPVVFPVVHYFVKNFVYYIYKKCAKRLYSIYIYVHKYFDISFNFNFLFVWILCENILFVWISMWIF